jgi:hypothetical protein
MAARFYGPFQVIKKISNVAYKLSLPPGSRIQPVFHLSLLKRYLGSKQIACQHLPEALEDGRLTPTPQAVLETRIRHKTRVAHSLAGPFSGGSDMGRGRHDQSSISGVFPWGHGNC